MPPKLAQGAKMLVAASGLLQCPKHRAGGKIWFAGLYMVDRGGFLAMRSLACAKVRKGLWVYASGLVAALIVWCLKCAPEDCRPPPRHCRVRLRPGARWETA